jgi:hypothetical protein
MKYKLIANLFPTVHLFADNRNYVLVVRENTKQEMRNGYHTYSQTLADVFEEVFTFHVRDNLANGLDKTGAEMVEIIKTTRQQIHDLMKPYSELHPIVRARRSWNASRN